MAARPVSSERYTLSVPPVGDAPFAIASVPWLPGCFLATVARFQAFPVETHPATSAFCCMATQLVFGHTLTLSCILVEMHPLASPLFHGCPACFCRQVHTFSLSWWRCTFCSRLSTPWLPFCSYRQCHSDKFSIILGGDAACCWHLCSMAARLVFGNS